MKTTKSLFFALLASAAIAFSSCDESTQAPVEELKGKKYIINYGNYDGTDSSVGLFEEDNDTLVNYYYKQVNTVSMTSNVQYAYQYEDKIFMMGNVTDQVFYVDAETFQQTSNGITDSIVKPRNCVAYDGTLFVTCWGGDVWDDTSLGYIAKIDIETEEVLGTIAMPGGPEGIQEVDGKLYVALNYANKIAVVDVETEVISYIETEAVSTYMKKDAENNLYVMLVSSFSSPSTEVGLGYIDTDDNALTLHKYEGVSASAVNTLSLSNDGSKVYVLKSGYDENWNSVGGIAVFDVDSQTFEAEPLVDGLMGVNGVGVDPDNDHVYLMMNPGGGMTGSVHTYKTDGTFVKEYPSGVSPFMFLSAE